MKYLFAKIILIFLFACWDIANAKEYQSCEELTQTAKSEEFQNNALTWADLNFQSINVDDYETLSGSGMYPGFYQLLYEPDFGKLNIPNSFQINFVVKSGLIQSIALQERTRLAILISKKQENEFGVKEKYLTNISPRIAVVCRGNK